MKKKARICKCGKEPVVNYKGLWRCEEHRSDCAEAYRVDRAAWEAKTRRLADAGMTALAAAGLAIGDTVKRYCPSMLCELFGTTITGTVRTRYGIPVVVMETGRVVGWNIGWRKA